MNPKSTTFKKSGGRCSVSAVASAPSFRLQGRGGSPSGPKIQAQCAVKPKPKIQNPSPKISDSFPLHSPLATLSSAIQGELDRVSQTLTGRICQLAERYATPLPLLTDEVAALAAKVDGHLTKMGAAL